MNAEALKEFWDGFRFAARSCIGVDREIADARAALAAWHLRRELAKVWPVLAPAVPSVRLGRFNPGATLRGVQSPIAALEQREEEPFPLCRVARLPGVPRTPTPARGTPRPGPQHDPRHDPDSLFTRALAWTLKSRRA